MVAIMSIVCLYVPTQEKVQNPGFGHGKVYLNKKVSYGSTQFSVGLVRLLSLWSASSPAREGLSGETRVGGIRGNVKFGAARRKPHARTGAWGRGWLVAITSLKRMQSRLKVLLSYGREFYYRWKF